MWLCGSPLPRTGLLWGHKCKEREQRHPTQQGSLPSQDTSDDFSETVSQVPRGRYALALEMAVPGSGPDKSMCFSGEGESLSHRNSHLSQSSRKTIGKVFSHSEIHPGPRPRRSVILTPESVNRRGSETPWANPRRCWSPSSPASYDKTYHSLDCCLAETFVISGQCLIG